MDIDDLKQTWQSLDRHLERHNTLAFQHFKDTRVRRLRSRLWPLWAGQLLQVAVGVAIVMAAARTWWTHWPDVPLRSAALILHLYGVAVAVAGARTMSLLKAIDYAAPVVAIQRQLGELREWYVRSGTVIGHAWWLLWMPAMMVLVSFLGLDLWTRAPRLFMQGTAIGVAGLGVTAALHVWSRRPRWTWLAARHEALLTGASLRRARAVLDEIARFERDEDTAPHGEAR